jgi:cytochrome c-type biogenesis protein CcmH/NrfG
LQPLEKRRRNTYTDTMKREKAYLLIGVAFMVGFILGAVFGIRYYASIHSDSQGAPGAQPAAQGPQPKVNLAQEIAQLEELLKRDPQNLQALISLGNAYFDSNQNKKAIDVYQKALAIDPKNADVRTDMAIMYRNLKEYDRAIQEFRQAAKDKPGHVNSLFNIAIVMQYDKKDIPGAIAAWEDFLKVEPTGDRANMARSQLEQLKGLAK